MATAIMAAPAVIMSSPSHSIAIPRSILKRRRTDSHDSLAAAATGGLDAPPAVRPAGAWTDIEGVRQRRTDRRAIRLVIPKKPTVTAAAALQFFARPSAVAATATAAPEYDVVELERSCDMASIASDKSACAKEYFTGSPPAQAELARKRPKTTSHVDVVQAIRDARKLPSTGAAFVLSQEHHRIGQHSSNSARFARAIQVQMKAAGTQLPQQLQPQRQHLARPSIISRNRVFGTSRISSAAPMPAPMPAPTRILSKKDAELLAKLAEANAERLRMERMELDEAREMAEEQQQREQAIQPTTTCTKRPGTPPPSVFRSGGMDHSPAEEMFSPSSSQSHSEDDDDDQETPLSGQDATPSLMSTESPSAADEDITMADASELDAVPAISQERCASPSPTPCPPQRVEETDESMLEPHTPAKKSEVQAPLMVLSSFINSPLLHAPKKKRAFGATSPTTPPAQSPIAATSPTQSAASSSPRTPAKAHVRRNLLSEMIEAHDAATAADGNSSATVSPNLQALIAPATPPVSASVVKATYAPAVEALLADIRHDAMMHYGQVPSESHAASAPATSSATQSASTPPAVANLPMSTPPKLLRPTSISTLQDMSHEDELNLPETPSAPMGPEKTTSNVGVATVAPSDASSSPRIAPSPIAASKRKRRASRKPVVRSRSSSPVSVLAATPESCDASSDASAISPKRKRGRPKKSVVRSRSSSPIAASSRSESGASSAEAQASIDTASPHSNATPKRKSRRTLDLLEIEISGTASWRLQRPRSTLRSVVRSASPSSSITFKESSDSPSAEQLANDSAPPAEATPSPAKARPSSSSPAHRRISAPEPAAIAAVPTTTAAAASKVAPIAKRKPVKQSKKAAAAAAAAAVMATSHKLTKYFASLSAPSVDAFEIAPPPSHYITAGASIDSEVAAAADAIDADAAPKATGNSSPKPAARVPKELRGLTDALSVHEQAFSPKRRCTTANRSPASGGAKPERDTASSARKRTTPSPPLSSSPSATSPPRRTSTPPSAPSSSSSSGSRRSFVPKELRGLTDSLSVHERITSVRRETTQAYTVEETLCALTTAPAR